MTRIEQLRRTRKYSARRIATELAAEGITISARRVERYNRILAEEFPYAHAWTSEQHRTAAPAAWNIHCNYHRPHTAAGNQPPASRLHTGVTNVMASYN